VKLRRTLAAGLVGSAAALLGVAHAALAWLLAGLLPWYLPGLADRFADQIFTLYSSPFAIAAWVVACIVFGSIVGAPSQSPPPPSPRRVIFEHATLPPTG
jgi:hypothetical protein